MVTILLDDSSQFQKVIGFGGAFTDSVGVNLNSLSQNASEKLINAYFAQEGKT